MQVSQRFHNNTYAPGIATYGIDGKTGDMGLPGTSMFFTDFDLTNNDEFKLFAQKITSRMLPIQIKEIVLDRKYVNGDSFVMKNGTVYMLKDINELSLNSMNDNLQNDITAYFEHIGNFSKDEEDDVFSIKDNNIQVDKLVITNNIPGENEEPETYDSNALLSINKINKGIGNVEFINMNALYGSAGNMNLTISYDNALKAFKLDSQYPIVIDSNLYVKQGTTNQTSQYSPVLTTTNGITNFYSICNNIGFNLDSSIFTYTKKDSSVLYYGSVYIVTLNQNSNLLNTLKDNNINLHFQNGVYQDFQLYRENELTYYFKQNYDYVKLNELITKVLFYELKNIQISLIYNIEIYIQKQETNLIGYK